MADKYFTANFDDFIHGMMEEWKMPGVAIGIVHGEDIYTKVKSIHSLGGRARCWHV